MSIKYFTVKLIANVKINANLTCFFWKTVGLWFTNSCFSLGSINSLDSSWYDVYWNIYMAVDSFPNSKSLVPNSPLGVLTSLKLMKLLGSWNWSNPSRFLGALNASHWLIRYILRLGIEIPCCQCNFPTSAHSASISIPQYKTSRFELLTNKIVGLSDSGVTS